MEQGRYFFEQMSTTWKGLRRIFREDHPHFSIACQALSNAVISLRSNRIGRFQGTHKADPNLTLVLEWPLAAMVIADMKRGSKQFQKLSEEALAIMKTCSSTGSNLVERIAAGPGFVRYGEVELLSRQQTGLEFLGNVFDKKINIKKLLPQVEERKRRFDSTVSVMENLLNLIVEKVDMRLVNLDNFRHLLDKENLNGTKFDELVDMDLPQYYLQLKHFQLLVGLEPTILALMNRFDNLMHSRTFDASVQEKIKLKAKEDGTDMGEKLDVRSLVLCLAAAVDHWDEKVLSLLSDEATLETAENFFGTIAQNDDESEIRAEIECFNPQPAEQEWLDFLQRFLFARKMSRNSQVAAAIIRVMEKFQLNHNIESLKRAVRVGEASVAVPLRTVKLTEMSQFDYLDKASKESRFLPLMDAIECSHELCMWLRSNVPSVKEAKTFFDLAMVYLGDSGDLEQKKIETFYTVVTELGNIVYGLDGSAGHEKSINEFLQDCQEIFQKLNLKPSLIKDLKETSQRLDWIKIIKENQGSVEKSTLKSIEKILQCGSIEIGCYVTNEENFQLRIHSTDAGVQQVQLFPTVFKLEDVKDLQSKLMLIAGQTYENQALLDRFVRLTTSMFRLVDVYGEFKQQCCILCEHMFMRFNLFTRADANAIIELRLSNQERTLSYSLKQILILQRELAHLFRVTGTVSQSVLNLLGYVCPDCSEDDVRRAIQETKQSDKKEKKQPAPKSNPPARQKDTNESNGPVDTAFKQIWNEYLNTTSSDLSNFEKVAQFLNSIGNYRRVGKTISGEFKRMGKSHQCNEIANFRPRHEAHVFSCSDSHLDVDKLYDFFAKADNKDRRPRTFHLDIAREVQTGFENVFTQLAMFGAITDSSGRIWRRRREDLYLLEHSRNYLFKTEFFVLRYLPSITCVSPSDALRQLEAGEMASDWQPLLSDSRLQSAVCKRPAVYLASLGNRNAAHCDLEAQIPSIEIVRLLLENCGIDNPSWLELNNFARFFNGQLVDFERSPFCEPLAEQDLPGFRRFVLSCLLLMSKDFSSRSLNIADESKAAQPNAENDRPLIENFEVRRRWEHTSHPYLLFNQDGTTFTFVGFTVSQQGHLLDSATNDVVQEDIMSPQLYQSLIAQRVRLQERFEDLSRQNKIERMRMVFGHSDTNFPDPDPSYELTMDNVKKMLAIYMRFRSEIPVVLMGETGCGKTKLVEFLARIMLPAQSDICNMRILKVHGAVTTADVVKAVHDAVELSRQNHAVTPYTILFFDEVNTTSAVGLIKEIMIDGRINGERISFAYGLRCIAACNPYRKHPESTIKRLENSGLGYRVRKEDTQDKFGNVPMRHLVYRVKPLPLSLISVLWDFGSLSDDSERKYITRMVESRLRTSPAQKTRLVELVAASQHFMRTTDDETKYVSLREVEKVIVVFQWLSNGLLAQLDARDDGDSDCNEETLIEIMALASCYLSRLPKENKNGYLELLSQVLNAGLSPHDIMQIITRCHQRLLNDISEHLPKSIAKNEALRENVFMMVLCITLRIPLFVVGKPGSSKSLGKSIVKSNMLGTNSQGEIFRQLPNTQMLSFQCSPWSTSEGIIKTFEQCSQLQKEKDLDKFVSVVILDEVGLAEDSPKMPLKALHPLLEEGYFTDSLQTAQNRKHSKVGFIGISNWALDPAKMNRGLYLLRDVPTHEDLLDTAKGICQNQVRRDRVRSHLEHVTTFYEEIYDHTQKEREFFGLRDYFSLVKHLASKSTLNLRTVAQCIKRNFSGFGDLDPVDFFAKEIVGREIDLGNYSAIRDALRSTGEEQRYLLLITENYSGLKILPRLLEDEDHDQQVSIIFGSSFPKDQDYSKICLDINRIKICMERGSTVVLLNMDALYESLYDVLNQYYEQCGDDRFVDLGLGTHRLKCKVNLNFRMIVVAEQTTSENEFSEYAKRFFTESDCSILILQFEGLRQNYQNLLACTKYLIEDHFKQALAASPDHCRNKRVVLLIKLVRSHVSPFTGFDSGRWQSVHIEEFIPSGRVNIRLLDGKSVATAVNASLEAQEKLCHYSSQEYAHLLGERINTPIDLKMLIDESIHQAMSLLKDGQVGNIDEQDCRLLDRQLILNDALKDRTFTKCMYKFIVNVLTWKDESSVATYSPSEWLSREAAQDQRVTDAGTFIESTWRVLKQKVAPAIACFLAFSDRDQNLNCYRRDGLRGLWMRMVEPASDLDQITENLVKGTTGEFQRIEVASSSCDGHRFACRFPFSWAVVERLERICNKEQQREAERLMELFLNSTPIGQVLQDEEAIPDLVGGFCHDLVRIRIARVTEEMLQVLVPVMLRGLSDRAGTCLGAAVFESFWLFKEFSQQMTLVTRLMQKVPGLALPVDRIDRLGELPEALFETFHEHLIQRCPRLNVAENRSQWINDVENSLPIVASLINNYGNNAMHSQWQKILCWFLFLKNVAAPFDADDTVEDGSFDPTRLWTLLNQNPNVDFKELDGLRLIEGILEGMHNELRHRLTLTTRCYRCNGRLQSLLRLPCQEHLCRDCLVRRILSAAAKRDCCIDFKNRCSCLFPNFRRMNRYLLREENANTCAVVPGDGLHDVVAVEFEDMETNEEMQNELIMQDSRVLVGLANLSFVCPSCRNEHLATEVFGSRLFVIRQFKSRCKTFLLEAIMKLCFGQDSRSFNSYNRPPSSDLCDRLLSYVTREGGDIELISWTTERDDENPVVFRSFLLQQLLAFNKEKVCDQLDEHLRAADNIVRSTDNLVLIVVHCLEDLWISRLATHPVDQRLMRAVIEVVDAPAPRIFPEDSDPLELQRLRQVADWRVALSLLATSIAALPEGGQIVNHLPLLQDDRRREQLARSLLQHQWSRVYFLRCLSRFGGTCAALERLRADEYLARVFREEMQLIEGRVELPDILLCHSDVYRNVRRCLYQAYLTGELNQQV
uniref:ATPase_AAA_core domain-containing protein n=3 Tax=Macrostomum lignano TaxID=282301 RepID=A0A1I8GFF8_9PLAT